MVQHKATYFLTPPRSGRIRLGTIIPSPTQPDEPLYEPKLPSPSDISTFTQKNWSGSYVKKSSNQFGIWTSFLEMIVGLGVDISVEMDKDSAQRWEVKSMVTQSFHPSDMFIEDAVSNKDVMDYIRANRFRQKIYMITGVMIASSTKSFRSVLGSKGLTIHAGVDLTAWTGVPFSVGPEGKWQRKEVVEETSQQEEEFVFAYRVREIRVQRKGGVKAHRPYVDGALFNTDKKRKTGEEDDVEVVGLGADASGEDIGLETKEVRQRFGEDDDEEECECVMPEGL